MYFDIDDTTDSNLVAANLFLQLGESLEQAERMDQARYFYRQAIRQGLIVRHIEEYGGISKVELKEIQMFSDEQLIELIANETSDGQLHANR